VPEAYPNAVCLQFFCDLTSAAPVSVTTGATTGGVDFDLSRGPQIGGQVTASGTGQPLSPVTVSFYDAAGQYAGRGISDASGPTDPRVVSQPAPTTRSRPTAWAISTESTVATCAARRAALLRHVGDAIEVTGASVLNVDFTLAQPATISGTVTDAASGAPLAGTTVVALDTGGQSIASATTNASGVYEITQLEPGTYYVRAEAGRGRRSSTTCPVRTGAAPSRRARRSHCPPVVRRPGSTSP